MTAGESIVVRVADALEAEGIAYLLSEARTRTTPETCWRCRLAPWTGRTSATGAAGTARLPCCSRFRSPSPARVGSHSRCYVCALTCGSKSRRLVHLVNYRSDTPVANAALRLRLPPGKAAQAVRLLSPEHPQTLELPFVQQADSVSFQVPRIAVYEIAAVEFRRPRAKRAS